MSENRYINPATTKKCRICRIFLQDLQVLQDFAGFCRIYRFLQESQDCGMPESTLLPSFVIAHFLVTRKFYDERFYTLVSCDFSILITIDYIIVVGC